MDRPVLDFMSDEFLAIQHACHAGVKRVLKTDQTLYMYNASGHGAWEAALANLFSRRRHRADRRDRLLLAELGRDGGQSRHQGRDLRRRLAQGRRRRQARASGWPRTRRTRSRPCSPSTTRPRPAWSCRWPTSAAPWTRPSIPPCCSATPSPRSASMEYKMDAWGIDVTVGGSQKGLMLPTGMSLTGVSNKAHRGLAQEQGAAPLLELGDDERPRAAEVRRHRAGAHVLRPAGIAEDARGGRPRRRVRPPCPPRRSDPRRRARLGRRRQGPAALRPGDGPALQLGDRGDDAGGRQLRRACARSPSTASTCRWAAGSGR